MFSWIKTALLEKWLGRLVVIGCAALGGFLAHYVPADVAASFIEGLQGLAEAFIPILIAWLFGALRHKIALAKMPE